MVVNRGFFMWFNECFVVQYLASCDWKPICTFNELLVKGNIMIAFGIAQYDREDSVNLDLASLLTFKEYRINTPADVNNISGGNWCIAHVPDACDIQLDSCIEAITGCPDVVAVNMHARPLDTYRLCGNCSGRMLVLNLENQCCVFCGTKVTNEEIEEELNYCTFDTVFNNIISTADVLRANGKRLMIENTFEPPSLMSRLFKELPEDVQFTLDVGHSLISSTWPQDYIYEMRNRLGHLHLHDNMGGYSERYHDLHRPCGTGIANWDVIAIALNQIKFSGTATFECDISPLWIRNWRNKLTDY